MGVVCLCVYCVCAYVCVCVCVDVCVLCTLISDPSARSCCLGPDPRAMGKGHGGGARASEQLGVKQKRGRSAPSLREYRGVSGARAGARSHGQPGVMCKRSEEAPSFPRDLQKSGPNPEPQARLRTQNESDPCLRPRETLTQAWPSWLPFPAPHGLLLNPPNLTRVALLQPLEDFCPCSPLPSQAGPMVSCPLCAQWTGQEQGQSESCWGSQGAGSHSGSSPQHTADCWLTLGSPIPPQALLSPPCQSREGTECFRSAFQLKTSPTFYLANGDADGDKNRCGKHFEKFIAGSLGREAFLLWGGRRGSCGQSRG